MTFIATALIINGAVYIRPILEQTNKTLGKPDKVGIIIKSVAKLIYNYYHGLASAAAQDRTAIQPPYHWLLCREAR